MTNLQQFLAQGDDPELSTTYEGMGLVLDWLTEQGYDMRWFIGEPKIVQLIRKDHIVQGEADSWPTAVALAVKAVLEVELVEMVSGHVTTKGDLARITGQSILEAE